MTQQDPTPIHLLPLEERRAYFRRAYQKFINQPGNRERVNLRRKLYGKPRRTA